MQSVGAQHAAGERVALLPDMLSDFPAGVNSSCLLPCSSGEAKLSRPSALRCHSFFPTNNLIGKSYPPTTMETSRGGKDVFFFCVLSTHSRSLINACVIEQGSRANHLVLTHGFCRRQNPFPLSLLAEAQGRQHRHRRLGRATSLA